MFENIIKSLQNLGGFSKPEINKFISMLNKYSVPSGTFILSEGEVCKALYFINNGAVRQFQRKESGEEITTNLFTEHEWIVDYKSFISQKPATAFTQAFSDCEIFKIDVNNLHNLVNEIPSFIKIGRVLESSVEISNLLNNTTSPEERYKYILSESPHLIHVFPLKYIASYLGMTPETLSRVRNRLSSK